MDPALFPFFNPAFSTQNPMFFQQAMGRNQLYSQTPPSMMTGLEGVPFMNGILGAFAAPAVQGAMQNVGLSPFSLSDRNLYDRMRDRMFTQQYQAAQSQMADLEAENIYSIFESSARAVGIPMTQERQDAARSLSQTFGSIAPVLSQVAPELLDDLGGSRGSPTVLAGRLMLSSRYRADPITGRVGVSPRDSAELASRLFDDLYNRNDISDMRGVSAGELGDLFGALQQRGMIGGVPGGRETQLGALESMSYGGLEQLTSDYGLEAGQSLDEIDPQRLNNLLSDDRVTAQVKAIDAQRVKQSLTSYVDAIAAVRDIFGDNGMGDAPMAQIIAGLDQLTQGGLNKFNPQQLESIVRSTQELSNLSGISLDAAMQIQTHAANRAQSIGLDGAFGVQAMQGSLAFGAAYNSMGMGGMSAYGMFNNEQMTQLDANLRVSAAGSELANRLNTALRIGDTLGDFEKGSTAQNFIEALRAGETSFETAEGDIQSINVSQADLTEILGGANLADGSESGLNAATINRFTGQKFSNRAKGLEYETGNLVRQVQGESDVMPFVSRSSQVAFQRLLESQGIDKARAVELSTQMGDRFAELFLQQDGASIADPEARNQTYAEITDVLLDEMGVREEIQSKAVETYTDFDSLLSLTAEDVSGTLDKDISQSEFKGYKSQIQLQNQHNKTIMQQQRRVRMQAELGSRFQSALSGVATGSPTRRIIDAIRNSEFENDVDLISILGEGFGGAPVEEIRERLETPIRDMRDLYSEYEELSENYMSASPGEQRDEALSRLEPLMAEIEATAAELDEASSELGLGDLSPMSERYVDALGSSAVSDDMRKSLRASQAIANVALESPDFARRRGLTGVSMATTITQQNDRLLQIASEYADGDIDKLSEVEDPELREEINSLIQDRSDNLQLLSRQIKSDDVGFDDSEMLEPLSELISDRLKLDKEDVVEAMRGMPGKRRDELTTLEKLISSETDRLADDFRDVSRSSLSGRPFADLDAEFMSKELGDYPATDVAVSEGPTEVILRNNNLRINGRLDLTGELNAEIDDTGMGDL